MKLSRTERWMLSNQYRILEALYPNEAQSFAETREALENGYELHYKWATEYIYDGADVMSEDECREVLDILQMFSDLKLYYERMTDKPQVETWQITFEGFDGNNETKQMAYARYFCGLGGGRFTELSQGIDMNSHGRTLDRYRRQLAEWKRRRSYSDLSREDIERIAAAANYPGG